MEYLFSPINRLYKSINGIGRSIWYAAILLQNLGRLGSHRASQDSRLVDIHFSEAGMFAIKS
jgi:hypothetical protein